MALTSNREKLTGNLPRGIILAGVALGVLALVWGTAALLPLRLLDFEHYLAATSRIWAGRSPYDGIEFFGPPWFALLLGPLLLLPPRAASAVWLVLNLAAVVWAVVLSLDWTGVAFGPVRLLLVVLVPVLLPAALFSYLTGQVSPLVGTALLLAAVGLNHRRQWPVVAALLALTFKPHIVLLPALLLLLELVRARRGDILRRVAVGLAALGLVSLLFYPAWPAAWLDALVSGRYRGGPGLVAATYVGLADIGVPAWWFAPLPLYVLWRWWRNGLTAYVMALALTVNLLVLAYSRSYDAVLLVLPFCWTVQAALSARRLFSRQTAAVGTAAVALFVLPWTRFLLLTPLVAALALLLVAPPMER